MRGLSYKLLFVAGVIVLVFAIQINLRAVSESIPAFTPTFTPAPAPSATPTQPIELYPKDRALETAAHNPTFAEMIAFLNSNKVNWQEYKENYDCYDFACALQREAFEHGIRCAFVAMWFPDRSGHAIVAFDTTDKGLIYIEPQADLPAKVEIGIRYWAWFYDPNYTVGSDDTIVGITLKWNLSACR